MIFLVVGDGNRVEELPSSVSASDIVPHVLASPAVVLAAQHFKEQLLTVISNQNPALPTTGTRELERPRESVSTARSVYVTQGERASPLPQYVQLAGTDEMTTCIGVVMWNPVNRRACVAHLDSPEGMTRVVRETADSIGASSGGRVDVHLAGCFDDSNTWQHTQPPIPTPTLSPEGQVGTKSSSEAGHLPPHTSSSSGVSPGAARQTGFRRKGYSHATAVALFRALQESGHGFVVRTAVILYLNTRVGPNGHPCPVIRGIAVNLHSGSVFPARFTPPARGPCLELRGACSMGEGSLSDPYDAENDLFVIGPKRFVGNSGYYRCLLSMTDEDLSQNYSTSPHAESADFVPHARRLLSLLARAPKPAKIFPNNNPLFFTRKVTWQQTNHDRSHTGGKQEGYLGHGDLHLAKKAKEDFTKDMTLGTSSGNSDVDAECAWVQIVAERRGMEGEMEGRNDHS